ncbi:MAG: 4Fe-4S dicluster domain-containing protein, partial [Bacillota bacterium]
SQAKTEDLRRDGALEKLLLVEHEKCTACRICELACSARQCGVINPAKARITVAIFLEDNFFFPVTCQHCEEPLCRDVCPTGAISKNPETGAVVIEESKCIGCRMCSAACPFGAISYCSPDGKAVKCDLCGGDPECVKFCPWDAIKFVEADSAMVRKRMEIGDKLKRALQEVKI